MSPADRVTVRTFKEFKKRGEPIVVLTAYDYQTAKILDAVGVDALHTAVQPDGAARGLSAVRL